MTRATASVLEKTQTFTGKGVALPRNGHHFLHIDDFSKEELWAMLQTAIKVAHHLDALFCTGIAEQPVMRSKGFFSSLHRLHGCWMNYAFHQYWCGLCNLWLTR